MTTPARLAKALLFAAALAALALMVVASVTRPHFSWDSWAYHLPFSARLWDVGGAGSAFVLTKHLEDLYRGSPLGAEFLQGALWKLTGTINATALINSAALLAFVAVGARTLGVSLPLLTFGILAVPMVAIHAASSYIDLFVAVAICFQVLAAVRFEAWARQVPVPESPRNARLW